MKKRALALSLTLMGLGSMAIAQDFNQYLSAKAVLNHTNSKLVATEVGETDTYSKSKNVGGLRLAYGLILPINDAIIRTELEYGYNGNVKLSYQDDQFETKSQSLMANIYYDFDTKSNLVPYAGIGLGYGRLKNTLSLPKDENYHETKSKGNFAWNVTVGATYTVSDTVSFDISYRYADYGKVTHTFNSTSLVDKGSIKLRGNEFNFGIRYRFPE